MTLNNGFTPKFFIQVNEAIQDVVTHQVLEGIKADLIVKWNELSSHARGPDYEREILPTIMLNLGSFELNGYYIAVVNNTRVYAKRKWVYCSLKFLAVK